MHVVYAVVASLSLAAASSWSWLAVWEMKGCWLGCCHKMTPLPQPLLGECLSCPKTAPSSACLLVLAASCQPSDCRPCWQLAPSHQG